MRRDRVGPGRKLHQVKWEQHRATEMEPLLVRRPVQTHRGSLPPSRHHSHSSEPSTPVKYCGKEQEAKGGADSGAGYKCS